MKTLLASIMALLLLLSPVTAQPAEAAMQATAEAGATPDSFWWELDVLFDDIEEMLSFSAEGKVETRLENARERLAELRAMADEQKIEAMAKAEQKHGETLGRLREEIKDIEDGDAQSELELELKLEQEIKEHSAEIEDIEDELKVKIKAKGTITPEQQALIDSILANLQGQVGEVEIEIKNEKGKTKIKIEQELGKSGDEVERELLEEIGLSQFDKERALKMRQKAENKWADVVEKAGMSVPDRSAFDDLLAQGNEAMAQGRFEEAKDLFEEAKDLAEDLKDEIEELEEEEEELEEQEEERREHEEKERERDEEQEDKDDKDDDEDEDEEEDEDDED